MEAEDKSDGWAQKDNNNNKNSKEKIKNGTKITRMDKDKATTKKEEDTHTQ